MRQGARQRVRPMVAGLVLVALVFAPAAPVLGASVTGCATSGCCTVRADMPAPCHHTAPGTCGSASLCATTAPAVLLAQAEIPSGSTARAQPLRATPWHAGLAATAPPTPPPNR